MVEMFWTKLHKKIINKNSEKGFEFYSEDKNDYSFLTKKRNAKGLLQLSFLDAKRKNEISINVKIIK